MAGVLRVNGFVESDQFFGREILSITVTGLVAAPALDVDGNQVAWDELDAAVQAIELTSTVSLVGVIAPGATACNLLVEGTDYDDNAQAIIDLSAAVAAVTGGTVVANAL